MKLTEVNKDPAIVDIEIPELESFDFNTFFNTTPARTDYGNLVVYDGRVIIPDSAPEFDKLCELLADPIKEITRKLMSMDMIRYPLFFNHNNFDDWWEKSIMARQRVGILPTIDKSGWSQPWHLDNRFIVISGSINIQDNTTSTHFAKENYHWQNGGTDFDHCDLIYQGRKAKFTGTAWINTEQTWHCVPRITEDQRKTILFNVFL